jgi:hypothetical protein
MKNIILLILFVHCIIGCDECYLGQYITLVGCKNNLELNRPELNFNKTKHKCCPDQNQGIYVCRQKKNYSLPTLICCHTPCNSKNECDVAAYSCPEGSQILSLYDMGVGCSNYSNVQPKIDGKLECSDGQYVCLIKDRLMCSDTECI